MAKKKRRRNVQMGFVDASGFHPIRASRDYDPDRAEGDEYRPSRRTRKKKAKGKKKRNPSSVLSRLARGVKAEWVALRDMGRGRKQLIIKTK